jgi:hypothetical protein
MSHVDKGALHAYLDGSLDEYPQAEAERVREHLDGCAVCAEMLEAERKVRADAEAMLALAVPDVDLPSLEELRAYVKRTRPIRQTASVRIYRMGWAASVVLALGTGWMLRGGALLESPQAERADFRAEPGDPSPNVAERSALSEEPTEPMDATAEGRVNEAVEVRGGAEAAEGDRMRARASVPLGRVGQADQTASLGGGYAASAERSADGAAPQTPSAKVSEAEARSAGALRAEAQEGGAPGSTTFEIVAREAERLETERLETEMVGASALAPADVAGADEVGEVVAFADALGDGAAPPIDDDDATGADIDGADIDGVNVSEVEPARSAVPSLAEPSSAADDPLDGVRTASASSPSADTGRSATDDDSSQRKERRRADSPVAVTSALEQAGVGSRQAPAEDDEQRRVEEVSMAVPGHELLSVTNLGEGTTPVGVQVVQRLEGGELLEIFHLQPEIEPSILLRRDDGVNEVSVLAENGWIVMRGRLTIEELEGLLASLFPED